MRAYALLLLLTLLAPLASARDLGTIGPVYRIGEADLVEHIESTLNEKAKTGELGQMQEAARLRAMAAVENPQSVSGLARTVTPRSFTFDPSVSFAENVVDSNGKVIIAAGTLHNPLDFITLSKHLLFFDARDAAQLAQARRLIDRYGGRVKPILVAGSFLQLMRRWKQPVYYDQHGALSRQLGITQVPALVSQEGRRLKIDELAPP
jgi:conjugal transfer pilus assembly protein TraW